jgi:starvation-inducible DNA-binding protein
MARSWARGLMPGCDQQRINAEPHCATSFDALSRLLALTTSLRNTYKLHYWRGLSAPFIGLRMVLGAHTQEQTRLVEHISRRLQSVRPTLGSCPALEGESWGPAAYSAETDKIELRLSRLLEAHQLVVIRAHCLANRLTELGDAESADLVAREVIGVNERQARVITGRLFAERRRG